LLLDTNAPDDGPGTPFEFDSRYKVPGRSFLVFVAGDIQ
jgi:isoamylase